MRAEHFCFVTETYFVRRVSNEPPPDTEHFAGHPNGVPQNARPEWPVIPRRVEDSSNSHVQAVRMFEYNVQYSLSDARLIRRQKCYAITPVHFSL